MASYSYNNGNSCDFDDGTIEAIDRGLCELVGCERRNFSVEVLDGVVNEFGSSWLIVGSGGSMLINVDYVGGNVRLNAECEYEKEWEFNCSLADPLLFEKLGEWFDRMLERLEGWV